MTKLTFFGLPAALLLAACSSGMGGAPTTASAAKADNATFLSGLKPASRQTVLYCQSQLQKKLGGTVYVVAAPSLQSGDITANSSTNSISNHVQVVYDRVDNGAVTSAAQECHLPSSNLVVRPSSGD
ncbi:hypothetical protein [Acidiphilium iwatense]|uniref:Lipoprotein n=1 Tax=Acidiphilium iwatense TaxID=768198 RepID=A0ABS9DRP9_9PROT|nr:hypothetical protein [Acidiphilium iwatense]MCF3945418.1 hypothetical protein [Acidiphilium iwatense]